MRRTTHELLCADGFHLAGRLRLEIRHAKSGGLAHVAVDEGPNLVVTAGLGLWIERMTGNGSNYLSHVGFGDDGSTSNVGMTALVHEQFRMPITSVQKTVSSFTVRAFVSENQGNGVTLREVGLFNTAIVGVPSMFARRVIGSPIDKDASKTVSVIWAFQGVGAEL